MTGSHGPEPGVQAQVKDSSHVLTLLGYRTRGWVAPQGFLPGGLSLQPLYFAGPDSAKEQVGAG